LRPKLPYLVVVWASVIWLSAPLLPALRNYRLVGVALLVACFTLAARRHDSLRALVELAMVAAVGGALYSALAASDPRVYLVEGAHFAEYGILAVLAFLAAEDRTLLARGAHTLGLVIAVALVDETIQWVLASRFAEVRDVALNVAAGVLGTGYAVILLGGPGRVEGKLRPVRPELLHLAAMGALLVPATGAFLYLVHSGHRIEWDEVEFVSRYSTSELDRTAKDRRNRWASMSIEEQQSLVSPDRSLWAVADFYVDEARRHIDARNHAANQGALQAATGENRILERWYEPYLVASNSRREDLPLTPAGVYISRVPAHLWPWLSGRRVWAAVIVAEAALIGFALAVGSKR
jgi:VanZ family protein